MAKAGAKPKPKKKPKLTDRAQSERFKETARKLNVDETGEQFYRAVNAILRPNRRDV